ncbi:MAG TPA: inclusion body family protein [Chitinophaga sp.]
MDLLTNCKIYPINILSVIDTDYILQNYPAGQDPDNPVQVDSQAARMICANARGAVSGEGSTDLAFKARKGDYVFFRGMSMSANSDAAIIIYNVQEEDHHNIFSAFSVDEASVEEAAEPNPEYVNGIPAAYRTADFSAIRSKVKRHGTATLTVQFGLYVLEQGQTQALYGYFQWNAKIKVEVAL